VYTHHAGAAQASPAPPDPGRVAYPVEALIGRSVQFRSENGLPALKQARAALNGRYLQGAAVTHVFFALPQLLSGIIGLLFGSLLLEAGDQYSEVKLVHLDGDLVFSPLQVVTRNGYFSRRNPVGCVNPDQLCQRLGELCAAREERELSLRERETLRRDGNSCHDSESSRRDLDKLQIRDTQRMGLVGDRRKIAGMFASLLLLKLSHLQKRDLQFAILANRDLDGLTQRKMPNVGGILRDR